MNSLFVRKRQQLFSLKDMRTQTTSGKQKELTENEVTCPLCKNEYSRILMKKKMYICPNCGFHFPISARTRIKLMTDKGSFKEQNGNLSSGNPLKFPGYKNKLRNVKERTGTKEAVITGVCTINSIKTELVIMDSTFMMGSMGTVVGEKVTRAIEYAEKNKLPLVIFSASGGARMQEGIFSLMQMAKTAAAIERYSEKKGFYLSILTHPTMGGVSASFAMLGDIILAEPKALIGFAGQRVIEQTIGEKLPKGFQRTEFQSDHGFVDEIVSRSNLKEVIGKLLVLHTG